MKQILKLDAWLVFNRGGIRRMTKGKPDMSAGEKAMRITLNVPSTVFQEPEMVAVIDFVDDMKPIENRMEILARVSEALDEIPEVFVTVPQIGESE